MKPFSMRTLLVTTLISLGAISLSPVLAEDDKTPEELAIEYRQSAFKMIKYHFGPMGAMVKGEKAFDAAEFAKNAEAVAALSKLPMNGFIPGSDMGETAAKDAIWKNMDDFKKKMETFQIEAASLAEIAKGGDMAAIKPQFGKVGESCKACHKEYREE